MEAPKCKFCGVVEWRHVCGGLAGIVRGQRKAPARSVETPVPVDRPKAEKTYNEYMRDYMRVWRAVKAGRAQWVKS